MDRKQFAKRLVELTELGFPELYATHIKARRRAFVNEHAPDPETEESGEVLGRIPQHLRILWAIAELLYEQEPMIPKSSRMTTARGICTEWSSMNQGAFGAVVELGFWECVMDMFEAAVYPRTKVLRMNHDWTVVLVPSGSAPKGTLEWNKLARIATIGMVAARTRYELDVASNLLKRQTQ